MRVVFKLALVLHDAIDGQQPSKGHVIYHLKARFFSSIQSRLPNRAYCDDV
jgi:hypothetical protein